MTAPAAAPAPPRVRRQAAAGVAAVALCFALFAVAETVLTWREREETRAIDHPYLVARRADLAREPGSTAIPAEIRREEQALRARFLVAERRLAAGGWLLLAGVGVFAAAAKIALAARPRGPVPAARDFGWDPDRAPSFLGRASLAGIAALLAGTAVGLPLLRERSDAVESARGTWARFRGAGGLGISPYSDAPLAVDAREGEERNLRWKAVTPLPGLSSPVVWNERVFLTGATASTREVYCYDALTGALLWRRPVGAGPASATGPESVWEETGYAAPTPVTDGAHVWALFANGDVVCLDVFGQQRWCRGLGVPENLYGLAASPILSGELLIVQIDQEWGAGETRSALVALSAATGEVAWRTPRDVESSWPTPIPIETPDGPRILTCANPFAIAYDPASGREVWRADCLEGDGGPSPVFAGGLVFVVNAGSPLTALRPDGEGDVTDSHVAWRWEEGLPDVCSPLAGEGLVWLLASDGHLTCLDDATGARVWEHDLERSFYSSPALAGDRVYAISRKGEILVIAAAREYRELARGHLGEECDTSPAFAEKRLYVRGRRHLFCFQEGAR
ncbi:MAG: PQQ-binding-like beta-propeller repeat protein [Planctomycetota bacterium]